MLLHPASEKVNYTGYFFDCQILYILGSLKTFNE